MLVSLVGERTQSWGEEEWITSSKHFITFEIMFVCVVARQKSRPHLCQQCIKPLSRLWLSLPLLPLHGGQAGE